jgi:hypothetical protein
MTPLARPAFRDHHCDGTGAHKVPEIAVELPRHALDGRSMCGRNRFVVVAVLWSLAVPFIPWQKPTDPFIRCSICAMILPIETTEPAIPEFAAHWCMVVAYM